MQRRVSECRGRWVLIRDRRTDLRYYVFSRASVINVSNTPRGSSPQTLYRLMLALPRVRYSNTLDDI